jgi:DNA-binding SARP family transcriptional activator
MGQLRIKLLGQLTIYQDDRPVTDLSAKALEMLCYLFVYRDRPHTRETLADLLWADVSAERAQKYFRQTLWQLQSVLDCRPDDQAAAGTALITLHPGWLRINPTADWWFDVDILERAYRLCHAVGGAALSDEQARGLDLAADLYEGDLLSTWHQDWCIYERERLQLTYLAILDCLMSFCEARQAYARGVAYGQRILRYDPARESTYQRLMRLHYLAGDRTTALREYRRCAAALAREFDLPPSQSTIALYELIRADRREDLATAPGRPTDAALRAPGPPAELHAQLEHLQASLAEFQTHVQQELAAISQLLRANLKTP